MENIHKAIPSSEILQRIIKIGELRERANSINVPFLTDEDLTGYVEPTKYLIINLKPSLKNQLNMFWEAQMAIIHQIHISKNNVYNAFTELNQKMYQSLELYNDMLKLIDKEKDRKSFLLALFYLHILRTESIGFTIKEEFDQHAKTHGLDPSIFDSNVIFSVRNKVHRTKIRNGSVKDTWVTDVKAIRDALAHHKYNLVLEGNSWKEIQFLNNEKGYQFSMNFSKEEFFEFINDFDVLYKSQMMIIFLLSAISNLKELMIE